MRKTISVIGKKVICALGNSQTYRITIESEEDISDFLEWFESLNPNDEEDCNEFEEKINEFFVNPTDDTKELKGNEHYLKVIKKLTYTYPELSIKEGSVYLDNAQVSMPIRIVEEIVKRSKNSEDLESLFNFWRWLVLNPDPEAREGAFRFIQDLRLSLTPEGMFVAYRSVNLKQKGETISNDKMFSNVERIENKIRNSKKHAAKLQFFSLTNKKENENFIVAVFNIKKLKNVDLVLNRVHLVDNLQNAEKDGELGLKIMENFNDYKIKWLGNLYDIKRALYESTVLKNVETVYTDNHTGKMNIVMNVPVSMPRINCNSDPNVSCSAGLHVGSENFGIQNFGNTKIAVLINPINIVAVPYEYGISYKMRVCEYLPICEVDVDENGKFINPGETFYSLQSVNYSKYNKEKLLELVKSTTVEEKVNYKLFNEILENMDIEKLISNIRDRAISRKIRL